MATLDGKLTDFDNAARAIGFAILFDTLDGRVARMMGTNSEFGKEFDSLADVVSFGIAPAVSRLCVGRTRDGCSGFIARPSLDRDRLALSAFSLLVAAPGGSRDSISKEWHQGATGISWACPLPPAQE